MERYRVNQVDLVSLRGKREGVGAAGAAHIDNGGGRRRKKAAKDGFGAKALQLSLRFQKPPGLEAELVVGVNFFRDQTQLRLRGKAPGSNRCYE